MVIALVAASCSSDSSTLEDELTSDIETAIEALNTFTVDREEQIERSDMQNPDVTWGELLAAGEEANAVVDFGIVDREADRILTVVQRARDGGLETVNGVSVDDFDLYATSLRDWSVAEAPQGRPLYECLVAAGTSFDLDTPMSVAMENRDVVDCLVDSMETIQESLDAQEEKSRYLRRINRDWDG